MTGQTGQVGITALKMFA